MEEFDQIKGYPVIIDNKLNPSVLCDFCDKSLVIGFKEKPWRGWTKMPAVDRNNGVTAEERMNFLRRQRQGLI